MLGCARRWARARRALPCRAPPAAPCAAEASPRSSVGFRNNHVNCGRRFDAFRWEQLRAAAARRRMATRAQRRAQRQAAERQEAAPTTPSASKTFTSVENNAENGDSGSRVQEWEAYMRGKAAPFVPAPALAVARVVHLLRCTSRTHPKQYFVDLGCGDGRFVLAAAEAGVVARAVGLEVDRGLVLQAQQAAAALPDAARDAAQFHATDLFALGNSTDPDAVDVAGVLEEATAVFVYMGYLGNAKLAELLRNHLSAHTLVLALEYPFNVAGDDAGFDAAASARAGARAYAPLPWRLEAAEPLLDLTLRQYRVV